MSQSFLLLQSKQIQSESRTLQIEHWFSGKTSLSKSSKSLKRNKKYLHKEYSSKKKEKKLKINGMKDTSRKRIFSFFLKQEKHSSFSFHIFQFSVKSIHPLPAQCGNSVKLHTFCRKKFRESNSFNGVLE